MYIIVYTMIMPTVIPVTQARRDFLALVDRVDNEYTRIDLSKNGRVRASLVSADYLESLEESLFTRDHSMADIRKAEAEIAAGRYSTLEEYLAKSDASQRSQTAAKRSKAHR